MEQTEKEADGMSSGLPHAVSSITKIEDSRPVDVGILIPLKEEFTEFHSQIENRCTPIPDRHTGRYDYLFDYTNAATNQIYRCVATFAGEMGPTKMGLLTQRLISNCDPTTVVILGIAGGIDKDLMLGDVVIATQVDSYLEHSKAVQTKDSIGFDFEFGGEVYRPSANLVNSVRHLEFAHRAHFQQWREICADHIQSQISKAEYDKLLGDKLIRDEVRLLEGHIASGTTVGAAKAFIAWLKKRDRKYLALEMEAGGFMAAAYEEANPRRTLVLRGISDYTDERKKELDQFNDGVFRRYAMNNAIQFLWTLLDAGVLSVTPENQSNARKAKEAQTRKPETPQQHPTPPHVSSPTAASVNKTELRKRLLTAFDEERLAILCADIEQRLEADNVQPHIHLNLEIVGGKGLETKILNLISWLDRRGLLGYLIDAVGEAQPG